MDTEFNEILIDLPISHMVMIVLVRVLMKKQFSCACIVQMHIVFKSSLDPGL